MCRESLIPALETSIQRAFISVNDTLERGLESCKHPRSTLCARNFFGSASGACLNLVSLSTNGFIDSIGLKVPVAEALAKVRYGLIEKLRGARTNTTRVHV